MAKRSKKKKRGKKAEQPVIKPIKVYFWDNHPNWTAMGIILILLLIFFYPVMFESKMFLPPDRIASKSFQPFIRGTLKDGQYPLWNPYIFGGMPSFGSLAAPYANVVQTIIVFILRILVLGQFDPGTHFLRIFTHYFLFGGAVYLLLRTKKLSPGPALFSSLALLFMPQVIAYAAFSHNTKLFAAMFIPMIYLLSDRLLNKRNLLFFCLTGLAIGLQILTAHVQICFYALFMVFILFIYWAIGIIRKEKKAVIVFHGGALILGAVLIGLILSSFLNLSVWEYSQYSIRGGGETGGLNYDYATNWSFPPSEVTTFFIPSFMGFGRETYWGPMPFTDFPLYFGLITFMLAGMAMVLNRNRTTWFFTILAIIVLFISFGKHVPILYGPMFKFFPFFNKFRAPKMIQILFQFSMVILAGFGFQGILNLSRDQKKLEFKKVKRYLIGFGGAVILLFLILLLGKGAYLGWASKAQAPSAAYDKAIGDGLKALLLFGLSAGTILATIRNKMNSRWLPFVLMTLLIVDLWIVDRKFVDPQPTVNEESYFTESPEVRYLKSKAKEDYFRVLPVGDQRSPNWYMYHLIQSVWGYHGATLRHYQEVADEGFGIGRSNEFLRKYLKVENGQYSWKRLSEMSPKELAINRAFLKLMNVKYIVGPYQIPDTTLQMVFPPQGRGSNGVMEFKHFLPRVFFPKGIMTIKGKEAILGYMTSGEFDPAKTAILEELPQFQIVASDSNQARISEYDIHRIQIETDIKTPSLLVLSEIYYPAGWKVFVDGQEKTIHKTNYILRSVSLEPGSHHVEFVFAPKSFKTGLAMSMTTFVLLLLGTGIGFWREKKKKRSVKESDT